MSVPGLAPIGGAIAGLVVGIIVGMILVIPTCVVAGIATNSLSRADEITGKIVNPMPFVGAALGFLIGLAFDIISAKEKAEAARRRLAEEEARAKAAREKLWALQVEYHNELSNLNEESLKTFESMPSELKRAEEHLDQSEREFSDGAFAPFWDSIERAVGCLARFDDKIRQIDRNSARYLAVAKKCYVRPGPFSVSSASVTRMTVAYATSKRMSGIVRKAQTNFQFSMIYEQRKTNQLLVTGFQNLAQALNEMTWHVTSAIDGLRDSIDRMGDTIGDSLEKIHTTGERELEIAQGILSQATDSAEREKLTIEMLDNIQRRRYPSFTHGGLREHPPA
jgi:hypothetical protein